MNKKFIYSIAATAALLFTSTGAASASSPYVEKKVYFYQSGNIHFDQLNSYLQNYLNGYWKQLNNQTPDKTTVQPAPVQESTTQPPAAQPAPAQEKPAPQPVAPAKPTESAASQVSAFEQKVVELTNQERAKQGLPALQLDTELSKVARAKSLDMKNNGYFSHTSPTYGSPFDMMKQFGISYRSAGENIAMGQRSPEEVVNAWMNSSGHRANILNSSYTHIGVGHVADGNYWTQMFIGK